MSADVQSTGSVSGSASGFPTNSVTSSPTPTATAASGSYTTATVVTTMAQLKKVAPKVYKAMIQGIAQQICSDSQKAQDRMAKEWKNSDNGG